MHGHESWQRMGILKVKKAVRSLNPSDYPWRGLRWKGDSLP